jgi:hypothetical protein
MDESKEALLEYFLILYRETPPPPPPLKHRKSTWDVVNTYTVMQICYRMATAQSKTHNYSKL